jgi:hypothetical protein
MCWDKMQRSPFVTATAPRKFTFICSTKSAMEVSARLPFRHTPASMT